MTTKSIFFLTGVAIAFVSLCLFLGATAPQIPGAPASPEVSEKVSADAPEMRGVGREPLKVEPVSDPAPVVSEYYRADVPLDETEQAYLYDAAEEFGVPYELALAVVWRETEFKNSIGDGGASYGYMQVQPRWWSDLAAELGVSDLLDPEGNFRTGCAILAMYLEKYGGTHKALMAYNCGEPKASRLWSSGVTSTEYSESVVAYAAALRKE